MLLEVLKHCYSSTEKPLFEHDPQAMDGWMDGLKLLQWHPSGLNYSGKI